MTNYLQESLLVAQKSPMTTKYGAVLVHNGNIISKGYNNWTGPIYSFKHNFIDSQCLLWD